MKLLRRLILIALSVTAGILILGYILLSPIAEYVIEKNSVKWTGRKIEMKSLWINLLTGTLTIKELNLYEPDQKKVFFSVNKIYVDIALYKIFAGKYDITEIAIAVPKTNIIQQGSKFNFDDMVKKFSSDEKDTSKKSESSAKWWLRKLTITDAAILYQSTTPESEIVIDSLNVFSPGMSYSNPRYPFQINLMMVTGGKLKTDLIINSQKQIYTADISADNFSLNFLYPYIKDYMYIKSFNGILNSEIALTGDLNKTENIALRGTVRLNDFSVIDTLNDKLTSFENVTIKIDSINTAAGLYNLNKISVINPFLNLAMYDKGFNYERILVTSVPDSTAAANAPVEEYTNVFVMMAHYIKLLTESYMLTNYKIDSLNIENGEMVFQDYTLEDKFNFVLNSAYITSAKIDSKEEKIHIDVRSGLNKSGKLTGSLNLYTANMNNMDINYKIEDMLISDINPYSKFYVATPFMNGSIYYADSTTIRDHHLKSSNQFRVEKIKVGNKTGHALYDMPIKLAISLITDLKGNINLDIPIEGDLNDPKFKVWPIIWQVLKNILLKAVTAPYRLLANAFGGNEDDYKEIPFYYLQKSLTEEQVSNLDKISKVLSGKPGMKADLMQVSNDVEEAEHIAVFEMKKQYLNLQSTDSLNENELAGIDSISIKDSLFVQFVNQKTANTNQLLSVQEKCVNLYSKEILMQKVSEFKQRRNEFIQQYLVNEEKIPAAQLSVRTNDSLGNATKNNVPRFVVNYNLAENDTTVPATVQ